MIPYSRQSIDDDDIAAVVDVLKGDWLTTGPRLDDFEHDLVDTTGARYAVAFANGTAALHAACAAAELGPGDKVATSPLSFVASANCARLVGAEAVFVDVDPTTLNLDCTQIPRDIDGLVAVHFAGLPLHLASLESRPRVVIEDASHALGATTSDGPVGNCARSDLCVFSFHAVKAITTGEGGAVTTNNAELAARLRRFRNHDMRPTPEQGGWAYDVTSLAWNYRLTDIQAALGITQLAKLDRFIESRNALAARYHELLTGLPIDLPAEPPRGWRHGRHLYTIQVDDRRAVYDGLRAAGIGAQVHYIPIYRLALYAGAFDPAHYPGTEAVADRLLSIPLYPDLTEAEQDHVVDSLRSLLATASNG
jgi:dTDP-4-amino-4,6-dideoxygalactose transaminase